MLTANLVLSRVHDPQGMHADFGTVHRLDLRMAKAKGTGKLNRKKTTPGTGVTATDRATDILSILELVKFARGESLRLGLEFEAYLLDMAALELANQFERTESAVGRISRQCSRSKT